MLFVQVGVFLLSANTHLIYFKYILPAAFPIQEPYNIIPRSILSNSIIMTLRYPFNFLTCRVHNCFNAENAFLQFFLLSWFLQIFIKIIIRRWKAENKKDAIKFPRKGIHPDNTTLQKLLNFGSRVLFYLSYLQTLSDYYLFTKSAKSSANYWICSILETWTSRNKNRFLI